MNTQQKSAAALEVFYSYSHKDEKLKEKLETHLTALKHQGVITGWHDRMIEAGEEWEGKIDEHLNNARIILLLVSADFLASPYCYDVEVKRAIERHEVGSARVIPIILKPCDWEGTPFGKLQALPKDGKPITRWANRDEAFTNIVSGIKAAVAHIPRISLQEAERITQQHSPYLSMRQQIRPRISLQEAERITSPTSYYDLSRQPKLAPLTIAITGSMRLPMDRTMSRIQKILSPYLDSHTTWYCGSFGNADEIAAEFLLQENQQVIVVGYNSYDLSERMQALLETHQAPFVDAQQEQLPLLPGTTNNRDILFYIKSDLIILIWDGQSEATLNLINWLRRQHKDHLVAFI